MKKLCAVVSVLFCLLLLGSCNSSAQPRMLKGTVLRVNGNSLFISTSELKDSEIDKAYVNITPSTVLKTSDGKSITGKDFKEGDSLIVGYSGEILTTNPPQIIALSITLQRVSTTENTRAEYRKISPEQAQEILKENQNAILVDVRTQPEYEEQRIPQSILIPNEEISTLAPKLLADKNATILVYCRTGVRSQQAALKLVELGYTNVYDIGGIVNWPYQTVSGR